MNIVVAGFISLAFPQAEKFTHFAAPPPQPRPAYPQGVPRIRKAAEPPTAAQAPGSRLAPPFGRLFYSGRSLRTAAISRAEASRSSRKPRNMPMPARFSATSTTTGPKTMPSTPASFMPT